jgi:hypothetical protein
MQPYQVGSTPTTYLIDQYGVIQTSDIGYGTSTESHLQAEIERLLEN